MIRTATPPRWPLWPAIALIFLTAFSAVAAPAQVVQVAVAGGETRVIVSLARRASLQATIDAATRRLTIAIGAPPPALANGPGSGLARAFRVERQRNGDALIAIDLARTAVIDRVRWLPQTGHGARALVTLSPADAIAMQSISGVVYRPDAAPAAGSIGALIASPDAHSPVPPAATPTVRRAASVPVSEATAPIAIPGRKRIIVIDAGHGGIDPGAESILGYHEKEVTLATARTLKRVLEQTGRYQAVLTRDDDTYLKLHERVLRARAAHGDLFVSLHADSVAGGEGDARGASIYTLSETASDAESERYAQRENRADALGGGLGAQSDDVAGILVDLTVRETVNGGNRFANLLVETMQRQGVNLFPRLPHRSAGFAVLKAPDIPSVLVEMGYLSDRSDARALADPSHQLQIAKGVAAGIDRYFAWVQAAR
jgi:N-acetylmuramoyl-L-alanine amidase